MIQTTNLLSSIQTDSLMIQTTNLLSYMLPTQKPLEIHEGAVFKDMQAFEQAIHNYWRKYQKLFVKQGYFLMQEVQGIAALASKNVGNVYQANYRCNE